MRKILLITIALIGSTVLAQEATDISENGPKVISMEINSSLVLQVIQPLVGLEDQVGGLDFGKQDWGNEHCYLIQDDSHQEMKLPAKLKTKSTYIYMSDESSKGTPFYDSSFMKNTRYSLSVGFEGGFALHCYVRSVPTETGIQKILGAVAKISFSK